MLLASVWISSSTLPLPSLIGEAKMYREEGRKISFVALVMRTGVNGLIMPSHVSFDCGMIVKHLC